MSLFTKRGREAWKSKKKISHIERARQASAVPPPLPNWPSSIFVDGSSSINSQSQSTFSTLPKELKLAIYELIFGCPDEVVHIAVMSRRLGGIPCWRPQLCIGWKHDCWGLAGMCFLDGSAKSLTATMGLILSLPLACKLLYSETIHYLYAFNTFNFRQIRGLVYFHQNLTSQNWQHIRAIEIEIPLEGHEFHPVDNWGTRAYPGDDPTALTEACHSLRSMTALEKLSVRITSDYGSTSRFSDPFLHWFMEPLLSLRITNFTIMIPQCLNKSLLDAYANAPFIIRSLEDATRDRVCKGCPQCPSPYDISTRSLNFGF